MFIGSVGQHTHAEDGVYTLTCAVRRRTENSQASQQDDRLPTERQPSSSIGLQPTSRSAAFTLRTIVTDQGCAIRTSSRGISATGPIRRSYPGYFCHAIFTRIGDYTVTVKVEDEVARVPQPQTIHVANTPPPPPAPIAAARGSCARCATNGSTGAPMKSPSPSVVTPPMQVIFRFSTTANRCSISGRLVVSSGILLPGGQNTEQIIVRRSRKRQLIRCPPKRFFA
jgi:hypothetical protein